MVLKIIVGVVLAIVALVWLVSAIGMVIAVLSSGEGPVDNEDVEDDDRLSL